MTQLEIHAPIRSFEIRRRLSKFDLRPARCILIASRSFIVRRFRNDENVYNRFMLEDNVAMNRSSGGENEILIACDLHRGSIDPIGEIVISILHELEHMRGVKDEREAERLARRWYERVI